MPLYARIDGDSVCIGTEEELIKDIPNQRFVVWKKLNKEELGLLLMGLQEELDGK